MFDAVPENWRQEPLGMMAEVILGQSPPSSVLNTDGVGLPFIQGNAEFGPRHPSPVLFASEAPKMANIGDVLLSVRAPVGEVNVAESPLCIGRGVAALRARACDPEFLFYAVAGLQPAFARLSQGSTFDAINGKELRQLPVSLPPLDEQRRIADVLRSMDRLTHLTSETLAATLSTKNAALIAALGDAWPETTVEELLAETRYPMRSGPFGSTLLKSELTTAGIPFLGIDNVQVERFVPTYKRFISQEKYQELARYTVYPDDVMVTIMGTVGRCCVVPSDVGTAISSKHVWTLTLDTERYSPALLAWQINQAPWVVDQVSGSSQGGIMSAISSGTLRGLVVPLPPSTELREIEQLLLSCNAAISTLEAELESAEAVKAALANDLLSGRVRVPA